MSATGSNLIQRFKGFLGSHRPNRPNRLSWQTSLSHTESTEFTEILWRRTANALQIKNPQNLVADKWPREVSVNSFRLPTGRAYAFLWIDLRSSSSLQGIAQASLTLLLLRSSVLWIPYLQCVSLCLPQNSVYSVYSVWDMDFFVSDC